MCFRRPDPARYRLRSACDEPKTGRRVRIRRCELLNKMKCRATTLGSARERSCALIALNDGKSKLHKWRTPRRGFSGVASISLKSLAKSARFAGATTN